MNGNQKLQQWANVREEWEGTCNKLSERNKKAIMEIILPSIMKVSRPNWVGNYQINIFKGAIRSYNKNETDVIPSNI